MVLCGEMWDPNARTVTQALGVVRGAVVIPHHRPGSDWAQAFRSALGPNTCLLGIPEMTALLWNGDQWLAAGPGDVTVYAGQEELTYRPGQIVPLDQVTVR